MPAITRVALRRVGHTSGKMVALPATMEELLDLATEKLALDRPARRCFSITGDEYEDLDLIAHDDVLFVTSGEDFAAVLPSPKGHSTVVCGASDGVPACAAAPSLASTLPSSAASSSAAASASCEPRPVDRNSATYWADSWANIEALAAGASTPAASATAASAAATSTCIDCADGVRSDAARSDLKNEDNFQRQ